MKSEPETLEERLDHRLDRPVSDGRQLRWIKELAGAASWLEGLDYFHCDMHPASTPLDQGEHVKICDFGLARQRLTNLCPRHDRA
jgi:serine/threonine protein kinase